MQQFLIEHLPNMVGMVLSTGDTTVANARKGPCSPRVAILVGVTDKICHVTLSSLELKQVKDDRMF